MIFQNRLKLQHKIGLLPLVSLCGLLIFLAYTFNTNLKSEARFSLIEEQDYPLFEIVTSNWLLLLEIEELFSESIIHSDEDLLADANLKANELTLELIRVKKIAPYLGGIADKMNITFSDYIGLASSLSQQMIDSGMGIENIDPGDLSRMSRLHLHFKNLQRELKINIRSAFSKKIKESKHEIEYSSKIAVYIVISLFVILTLISIFITRLITKPLNHVISVSDQLGEGQWDNIQDRSDATSNDELGQLIISFSEMKRKLKTTFSDLELATDVAHKAERSKAEFLATMSHEIRTPMNGILGMAELLQNTLLNKVQKDYVDTILNSGNLLLTITNDILDYSKLESGKVELETIPFNLEYLTYDIIDILGLTIKKDVQLILDYPPDAPHVFLGDPSRLRQVIYNLIGNAIKFTEKGYIRLSVSCTHNEKSVVNVNISVEDTGIGMTTSQQNNLFQAFSQADSSTTRKYGGTGLGLDICQKLIHLMGGEIKVNSEHQKGATFQFNIKLEEGEAPETFRKATLKGVKILMVDDNKINRNLFSKILNFTGATTTILSEANTVIPELHRAIIDRDPYQIAVLDFNMPVQNGLSLGKEILSIAKLKYLRLVMMTSSGTKGDTKIFSEAGFSAYLSKPIRGDILQHVLEAVHGMPYKTSQIITKHSVVEDQQKIDICNKFDCSVLLVEDTEVNRMVAKFMLANLGAKVDIANDGMEAVEMFNANNYDLIFMDCRMPIMNGYEATIEIRKTEESTRIPIIALTANVLQTEQDECKQAGMDDFVAKPMKQETLERILNKWLPESAVIKTTEDAVSQLPQTSNADQKEKQNDILDQRIFTEIKSIFGDQFTTAVDKHKNSTSAHINNIATSLKSKDMATIERESHSLKGASAQFGAIRLSIIAYEIETLASDENNIESIYQKLDLLKNIQKDTIKQINQFLN